MKIVYNKLPNGNTEVTSEEYPQVKFDIPGFKEGETDVAIAEMDISTIEEFIGLALHSIQQYQSYSFKIHGYGVYAMLMDQTVGNVSLDDVFRTTHPNHPYQRLKNILENNFTL